MSGKTSQRLFRLRLDRMVSRLRDDIVEGKLAPGDFLPAEATLAEQFSLSNKSVRQGLDVLVEEGLIVKIPRVGSQVTEAARKTETILTLGVSASMERDIALSTLLQAFHHKHPHIRVRTITLPGTSRHFVQEYIGSGLVDAFLLNHQYVQELLEQQLLDTLEPLQPAPDTYRFLDEAFTVKGIMHAQPIAFSPIVLCYNKAHFREAGLAEPDSSWTWDDTLACAQKLFRPRARYGLTFHAMSTNRWPLFLLQSGMRFANNVNGECDIADTPLLQSIQLYDRIIHEPDVFPSLLAENSADIGTLFLTGQTSMFLTSYMSLNDLIHSDLDYDISTPPYMSAPHTLTVAFGVAINRSSPLRKEAHLLTQFLSSEEGQRVIRRHTVSIPALKPVAETRVQDKLNRPERFDLFRDILPTMQFHDGLGLTGEGFAKLSAILKQYWSHLIDEETLCRLVKEQISPHVIDPRKR